MKPISLEMQAFGPYGDRAAVDFEPLADVGLFVVSGPTGAGKSTIFDAICFALFGSLSGSRASHNDVRSHYADPHAKCTVVLVFDAEGQRWRVTRQPSQTVQKKRGSGTTVHPATAVLERWNGSDWAPDTTKVRDVTARCRDLVGLSLEQFERVVLLPQGQFAEVLNAKTSERSELLRTLFGSEIFDRAATILGEQAKAGEAALRGVNEQRAYFHERAVDAIDRIEAALGELPAEVLASAEIPDESPVTGETQLSLLDAPDTDSAADPAPAEDRGPAEDLAALIAGPVASLTEFAESRRIEAETARAERDRAESQRRSIEQRAETLRLLAILEARSDDMAATAARAAVGQKLVGLDAALAERRSSGVEFDRMEQSMAAAWERVRQLVPVALPGNAALPDAATADTIASLLERTAARSAALDLVDEERHRLAQLRREQVDLTDRLAHLEAIAARDQVAAEASETERSALAEERDALRETAAMGPQLDRQIEAHDKLLVLRRRADAAAAEIEQLTEQLSAKQDGAARAQAAMTAADAEIAALSIEADEVDVRRIVAAEAVRRCDRRADLDAAMTQLRHAESASEAAKADADACFRSFVGQTAPRLAADLRDDEPCPVCGSLEHPAPADGGEDAGSGTVDVTGVERSAAAASAADIELTRVRTTVANLIDGDSEIADVEPAQLAAQRDAASAALASAEQARRDRSTLVAGREQLAAQLVETEASVEQVSAEVARGQLALREIEGALGESVGRSAAELDAERAALCTQRADVVRAVGRLDWIRARRAELATAAAEAERLGRQRSIDQATASDRIAQLTKAIEAGEAQLDKMLGGVDLDAHREAVQSLRSELNSWQDQSVARAGLEAARTASTSACAAIVEGAGFDDEASAIAAIVPSATLEQLEASYGRWSHELAAHRAALVAFDIQDLPEQAPDLEQLTAAALASAERQREIGHVLTAVQHSVASAEADLAEVAALDEAHAHKRAEHETLQRVANVVRGQNSRRLSLENWVLSVYLNDVVEHANLHLSTMSNGRYRLVVQDAPASQVGQHGLDLVVDDAHTGRVRSSMSLSGGETFQASLALALGLADVVMLGRAGLHLDALFVDEGFGSLDADAIDQAITVLDGLRSRGSMVGVITHVEALKNALPVAIDVQPRADHRGSQIRQVA